MFRSNAVAVVDLDTMTRIGEVIGLEPIDVTIDDQRGLIFTADARSDQPVRRRSTARRGRGRDPRGELSRRAGDRRPGPPPLRRQRHGRHDAIVDLDSLAVLDTVTAEIGAGAVAVDPRYGRAYCVNFLAASVTVVDLDTRESVARLDVGAGPCAVAVNPVDDEVYVINSSPGPSRASTPRRARPPATSSPPGARRVEDSWPDRTGTGSTSETAATARVSVLGVDGHEWTRIPVSDGPGGVSVHPERRNRILVANAGSGTLTVADDLTTGPPTGTSATVAHPLVGLRLPEFALPEMRTMSRRKLSKVELGLTYPAARALAEAVSFPMKVVRLRSARPSGQLQPRRLERGRQPGLCHVIPRRHIGAEHGR